MAWIKPQYVFTCVHVRVTVVYIYTHMQLLCEHTIMYMYVHCCILCALHNKISRSMSIPDADHAGSKLQVWTQSIQIDITVD
jgi:hypothetical protein